MEVEEQIFQDFQNGSVDLFYKRMYPQLLSYAIRLLGSDFSFWAEDCVQDSFYKAYTHREELSNVLIFKSFLYSCIHNQIISIIRHNQVHETYTKKIQEEESESFVNSLIQQETLNLLSDALRALPDKLYEIFDLSFVQNKKNNEIAEILNVSESTVKRQKLLLVETLRSDLKKRTGNDLSSLAILLPILTYLEMSI
jgi:RNA polymerase sigma-70 factor (ECF subfamily)